MNNFESLKPCQPFIIRQTACILKSYKHWLGKDLISCFDHPEISAKALFEAPFVLVSSTAEKDPLLNYGNQAALHLWEMAWTQLTKTPGKETAEPMEREERENFLRAVKKNGFVDNYQGIRISSTGKRFHIKKATVWNLIDEDMNYCGQAATFSSWNYL